MSRQLRISSVILLVAAVSMTVIAFALGRSPTPADDYSLDLRAALLLLMALVTAVIAFVKGFYRTSE